MARTKKIERIKAYHPGLYDKLCKQVPELIKSPENATSQDIKVYNDLISDYAKNRVFLFLQRTFRSNKNNHQIFILVVVSFFIFINLLFQNRHHFFLGLLFLHIYLYNLLNYCFLIL